MEFMPRGTFQPVADMVGGGPFDLNPGEWTDDTSMALCLAHSLVHSRGFNAADQMNRYCNWRSVGYMSSNGRCFDIGMTVASALDRYLLNGDPYAGSPDPRAAGNGALMRLAPVPMYFCENIEAVVKFAGESTRTTHGAREAIECSKVFGLQLRAALLGSSKDEVLAAGLCKDLCPSVGAVALGEFRDKSREEVKGSGYCVQALEAALWCFATTETFETAVLTAANLGDDADTTAAICGQLAGAFYGASCIPAHWLERLVMRTEIAAIADQLLSMRADCQ